MEDELLKWAGDVEEEEEAGPFSLIAENVPLTS